MLVTETKGGEEVSSLFDRLKDEVRTELARILGAEWEKVWLSADHGAVAGGRLARESQAGRAAVATRRAQSAPRNSPTGSRLWLTDGSCVRCRPAYRLHVWAYDFLTARTHDGRPLQILVGVDEYSRECLAIRVARRLRSTEVLETLAPCVSSQYSQTQSKTS